MSETYVWKSNIVHKVFKNPASYLKWNYQEYFLRAAVGEPGLFIIQPKRHGKLYELWLRCPEGTGDRYDKKNFKCLNKFKTLKAAKLAYILYWKAHHD
jgi:hypothetical protein